MKRVWGFIIFWFALGMVVCMFLPNDLCRVVIIGISMLISYYLFSCKR
ncbi:MAG: hypothetical protein J6B26_03290 [Agathobacter sp.]|nr:hypothetical protein [Agathobacter sp.]